MCNCVSVAPELTGDPISAPPSTQASASAPALVLTLLAVNRFLMMVKTTARVPEEPLAGAGGHDEDSDASPSEVEPIERPADA